MKVNLLLFLLLLLPVGAVMAQQTGSNKNFSVKKQVVIPAISDSTAGDNFCICKVVSFMSDNHEQRTDAIFAGSTAEKTLSKKELLKKIEYELQQAMVFFDSYKLVKQYAAPVDCNSLYKYLKTEQENIKHFTVLLPPYASR